MADTAYQQQLQQNFAYNQRWAKAGPYFTKLSPAQETQFRDWIKKNNINFDPNAKITDYDMRGFWLAQQQGKTPQTAINPYDRKLHFTDEFKTPYDRTFSNQSRYAHKNAPHWQDNRYLISPSGQIIFDQSKDTEDSPYPKETASTDPSYLDQFKARYPQYRNVPDADLAKAIYNQHYAKSMTWNQFSQAIGYSAPLSLPAQPPKTPAPSLYTWKDGTPFVNGELGAGEMAYSAIRSDIMAATGAMELVGSGIDRQLTSAIYRTDQLGTELYDLARYGGFPNSLNADTEAAILRDSYKPQDLSAKAVEHLIHPVTHVLGEVVHAVTKPVEHVANKAADVTQAKVQKYSPLGAALLGAEIKSLPTGIGLLLTTDNPLTSILGKLSTPLRETAAQLASDTKAATRDALVAASEKTGILKGRIATAAMKAASRDYENGMYELQGQQLTVDHDATEALRQGDLQLSKQDLYDLERYYEDPTGSYPLTAKQKVFASMYLEPMRSEVGMQPGYVPRVSLEHANFEVSAMRGEAEQFRGKRPYKHLSTDVDAYKSRGWYRLVPEDGKGPNMVAHLSQYENPEYPGQYRITALHNKELQDFPTQRVLPEGESEGESLYRSPIGSTVADTNGKSYRIETATRSEISHHSGKQFVENPVYTITRAWHQIRTAQITEAQKELTKRLLANYIRKPGEAVTGDVPIESRFFKGENNQPLYAPKPVANVIEAFMGNPRGSLYLGWRSFNHAILTASFVVPVWHGMNMVSMAMMEKLPRMLEGESWTHYGEAMHEVLNMSGQYRELVQKGYPFWTPRIYPQTLHETAASLLREMDTAHAEALLSKTGMALDTAKKGLKWYRDNVIHSVGPVSDTLTMSAIKERMAVYKEDLTTAADKVFQSMPQYRIRPTQALLHTLNEAQIPIFWFLPYHADRIAILWRRVKGAAGGDPEQLSRLAGNVLMATVIYPRLDQALRESTNNPKAHIERFGTNRIVADVYGAAERTQPDARLLGDLLTENGILATPASMVSESYRLKKNPSELAQAYGATATYPSHMEQLKKNLGYLPIYPIQNWVRAGGTGKGAVLGQFGIFIPPNKKQPQY